MPSFTYKYIDQNGKRQNAEILATDQKRAKEELDNRNIVYLDIYQSKTESKRYSWGTFHFGGMVTRRDLIEFCIYMATLSEAGLSIIKALDEFSSECHNEYFKSIIIQLRLGIESGKSIAESMTRFPRIFSSEFISLVRAGEKSGTMPQAFREIKGYLEWLEKISADVKQATVYPLFIFVALICFMLFLFSYVVPKITSILVEMRLELPLITRIVTGISAITVHTWYIWLTGLLGSVLFLKFVVPRNQTLSLLVDSFKLRIPLFGNLIRLIIQARFSHNFAILHKAGISVLENLELCMGFIGNRVYTQALHKTRLEVQEGINISTSLKSTGLFSGLVIRMFAVGEASGDLENALHNATNFYNEEIPRKLKKMFSIMEPLVIITLVGIIGCVALALFMPILTLTQGMK